MKWVMVAFLFFAQGLSGQTREDRYNSLWKRVDSLLMDKGLPKSALAEVDKIYEMAKGAKNRGQLLRAMVYRINLRESGAEDGAVKAIAALEKEVEGTKGTEKAILNSVLAQGYLSFFEQNRWKLYRRTATMGVKKEDLNTWGVADFHGRITALYMASLEEEQLLKDTKLTTYDALLVLGTVRSLRPTLYDLLANRALEYFKNDERDLARPAFAFEINQAAAFDPAADFFAHRFVTQDSLSMQYKALLLYQKLVAFHLYDSVPDALIDIDLQRLQYVKGKAVMENKEYLYYTAVRHVAEQYQRTPAAAQAWYLLAQWHAEKAAGYKPLTDTAHRYEYMVAAQICEQVLLQEENTEGRANCANLLQRIRHKQLVITSEKVNLPDQPFRNLVSYRNISEMHLRVVAIDNDFKKSAGNRYGEEYWKQLVAIKPLKSWIQALPDTRDHQQHLAEIKIDALPVGNYMILASTGRDFSLDDDVLAVQFIYVSAISFVNNGPEYFVLHRETGKPLANAGVQVWNNYYDYKTRKINSSKAEKIMADKRGYFKVKDVKDRNEVRISIDYGNDRLDLDESFYSLYSNRQEEDELDAEDYEEDNARVFLFADRSIYRPGQTIFFKGIATTKDFITRRSKVMPGEKTKLFLEDANGTEIDSVVLTTNEFGTYSGKFRLPENTLNGEFTLRDDTFDASLEFSVEEYKRPRFFLEYEKLKGTYKVNDSISVKGFAKAFAGNNIDGAAIHYRVVRQPRFMYPWRWSGRGRPSAPEMEITSGEALTAGDGTFVIRFKAIPDASVDQSLDPVFDYRIIADVTDNNGETRSGETSVSVSYKSLLLKIVLPMAGSIPADSLHHVIISTKNTNDVFEPALVQMRIYSLKTPGRLIRDRLWEEPDQFVMDEATYVSFFPHDEYASEKKKEYWVREKIIAESSDSSKADGKFSLAHKGFLPGWYLLEATTVDKYGSPVKDIQYLRLYDPKNNTLVAEEYIATSINNGIVQPGGKASVALRTSAGSLTILEYLERPSAGKPGLGDEGNFKLLDLDRTMKTFEYDIRETDRGGIGITYFFVRDNRFYIQPVNISVPWTNKELQISYETYRDKTLPGSEERWKMKISGSKNEKVAAEMMVSMYDASLDQFKAHSWNLPNIWPYRSLAVNWNGNTNFRKLVSQKWTDNNQPSFSFDKQYDAINVSLSSVSINTVRALQGRVAGMDVNSNPVVDETSVEARKTSTSSVSVVTVRGMSSSVNTANLLYIIDGVPSESAGDIDPSNITSTTILKGASATALYGARAANGVIIITTKSGEKKEGQAEVQVRKNFNETAFFFPDLHTDEAGNISFSFTMPEALTTWKFQGLAHTTDLALGYTTANTVTRKELMVQPNAPRFIREGDRMLLSTKIVNLSGKELTGTIELQLLDAATMQPADGIFHNISPRQYFTTDAGKSVAKAFTMEVPYQYNSTLVYRFIARSLPDSLGNTLSDGEEAVLPVLSNSMLVTESLLLPVRGNAEKKFSFQKLLQSGSSETLKHQALTVEFSSNPAWTAVQALPYLMEYPYECAEQTFNRFYANALASTIVTGSPRLKQVFERWKIADTSALLSNLEKNAELKSILLEETPWVLEAKTESQQKKNIALLFDGIKMEKELNSNLEKLLQMQSPNGGFAWFNGGPDDRFITQYILTGIGHLQKLQAVPAYADIRINELVKAAIPYLDARIRDDYERLISTKADSKKNHIGHLQVQFLYMRSFFPAYPIPGTSLKAITYYRSQSQQFWVQQNRYLQGMIALSLFRTGDRQTASAILKSLKENAVINEETGMYWADNRPGYFWYQAPVETQSLLIEAFHEISNDRQVTADLKTWLLQQKQTQSWPTTKATADACYALLLEGNNWLANTPEVTIQLGNKIINSNKEETEAGTGYFKVAIEQQSITPRMGNISVRVQQGKAAEDAAPAWGAVYWQYFERLDKITPSATPLKLVKKLFIEKNSDRGPVLEPVQEGQLLKVGDKIKVRIELRVDRDMEYVHMKDMRASCMEPVNVLSGYKWQGGLGYYESTRDAATHFFFDRLSKGTYVFEYPLFAGIAGNFSNGITTIQCMYAPEFTSNSEGIRVNVE